MYKNKCNSFCTLCSSVQVLAKNLWVTVDIGQADAVYTRGLTHSEIIWVGGVVGSLGVLG